MKSLAVSGVVGMLLTTSPVVLAAEVAVAFSPGAGGNTAEALVIDTIDTARRSIRLAAYSFTSKKIAASLVSAKRRGVDVRAVLDDSNLKADYSGAQFLANEGVLVRIDSAYAIMHNKFLVVDGTTVQTGSFNYTNAAAQRNAENAIVLRGQPKLAQDYETEWQRLWDESRALNRKY